MRVVTVLLVLFLLTSVPFGVLAETLPDYPYIAEDETVRVNLREGETIRYLFRAEADGVHTQGMSYSTHTVILHQVDGYSFPEMIAPWMTDTAQGAQYHLTAGDVYIVEISGRAGVQLEDGIWIRRGEPPKNEYPVWGASETVKQVDLSDGGSSRYYFTPEQSGEYALFTSLPFFTEVYDAEKEREIPGAAYVGGLYTLNAGQTYTVELTGRNDQAHGAVYLEKVRPVTQAEIYIAQSTEKSYVFALKTDPPYALAEGVQWSISDRSLFKVHDEDAALLDVEAVGRGTATITAVIGGITCTYSLTVGGGVVPPSAAVQTTAVTTASTTATTAASTTESTTTAITETTTDTTTTDTTTTTETTADTAVTPSSSQTVVSRQELTEDGCTVAVNGCELHWDAAAVRSLLEQTAQTDVVFCAERRAVEQLTQAQQAALADGAVGFVWELRVGDGEPHRFGDGTVTVTVPFAVERDRRWRVCYLAEDGTTETMNAQEENGKIRFETNHFSTFVLLYEEDMPQTSAWLLTAVGAVVAAGVAVGLIVIVKRKKVRQEAVS